MTHKEFFLVFFVYVTLNKNIQPHLTKNIEKKAWGI